MNRAGHQVPVSSRGLGLWENLGVQEGFPLLYYCDPFSGCCLLSLKIFIGRLWVFGCCFFFSCSLVYLKFSSVL